MNKQPISLLNSLVPLSLTTGLEGKQERIPPCDSIAIEIRVGEARLRSDLYTKLYPLLSI
jgi:hypothetical protein